MCEAERFKKTFEKTNNSPFEKANKTNGILVREMKKNVFLGL